MSLARILFASFFTVVAAAGAVLTAWCTINGVRDVRQKRIDPWLGPTLAFVALLLTLLVASVAAWVWGL